MNEDLVLGPYKLPLKKVETGFGYFGAVSFSREGSIQCHICGELRDNLSLHLRQHDINVADYREKFGISLSTPLTSEKFRNASVTRMLELRKKMAEEGSLERITRLCQEGATRARKKGGKNYKKGRTWMSPENLNLKGICPDQLIELIRKAHDHYKATPSYAEFLAYYQTNRFATPIKRTFGSWKNAVRKAGYEPKQRVFSTGLAKYDDEELVETLSDFYKENRRVPTYSDFKRGFLPTWETYVRRFGSMQEARLKAGITDTIKRGGDQIHFIPKLMQALHETQRPS